MSDQMLYVGSTSVIPSLDTQLDLAVRAWGLRDPRARAVVARVDARRIQYLADLVPRHVPRARRELMGRLEYAAFLGNQQLDPGLEKPETHRVERLVARLLSEIAAGETSPLSAEARPRR